MAACGAQNTCPDVISAWINDMSGYLRSVDPNHLISVGEEGYWGAYDPSIIWNPNAGTSGGGWVPLSGQNFTNQTANPAIDFAVQSPSRIFDSSAGQSWTGQSWTLEGHVCLPEPFCIVCSQRRPAVHCLRSGSLVTVEKLTRVCLVAVHSPLA